MTFERGTTNEDLEMYQDWLGWLYAYFDSIKFLSNHVYMTPSSSYSYEHYVTSPTGYVLQSLQKTAS